MLVASRFFADAAARQGCGMLFRNKTFRTVKSRHALEMSLSPGIPSTRLWHPLNVPLPRPAGRSLAELGFLVPSKLPQGSFEPRHSAPSKRGLQHGGRPVRCAALFTTKVAARAAVEVPVEAGF